MLAKSDNTKCYWFVCVCEHVCYKPNDCKVSEEVIATQLVDMQIFGLVPKLQFVYYL